MKISSVERMYPLLILNRAIEHLDREREEYSVPVFYQALDTLTDSYAEIWTPEEWSQMVEGIQP